MAYWGAYSASKTYYDGDCVIGTDGVLYLCVKNGTVGVAPVHWPGAAAPQGAAGATGPAGAGIPTPVVNGQWVKGVGGAAVWSPIALADVVGAAAKPSYGTTFPASPVDGQEHILVDSTTNPTRVWHCRYNGVTTNSYKWDVIGGTPILGSSGQNTVSYVSSWVNVCTSAIVLPVQAFYVFTASLRVNNGYGAAQHVYMMHWYNAQSQVFGPQALVGLNSGWWGTLGIGPFITSFVASTSIGVALYCDSGQPVYGGEIAWSAMPVRILA
jgi:hypothetical protein